MKPAKLFGITPPPAILLARRRGDRMSRRELPVASGTIAFLIGAVLLALPSSLANARQPPQPSCVGVSKTEYDSAYEAFTYNRFGYYERTREGWRRYYWYCSLYETTAVQ